MKKSFLWILLSVVVLIVILVISGKRKAAAGIEVNTSHPFHKTITEVIPANGKIQPVVEVKISPDVSGEIVTLNVKEGDKVTAGQVLLQIKRDQYLSACDRMEASLNQVRAQLAQAQAQYEKVTLSHQRNQQLFEQGAISTAEYEVSLSEFSVAKEQLNAAHYNVKSAEAGLAEAQESLAKTTIFAPLTGIVSKLDVERGERVVGTSQMAGTEMLRVADFEKMEVLVDVNENDIVRVKNSDTASIEVDAYPGRLFTGIVTDIANSAKNVGTSFDQVTNFEVKIFILPESYQDLVSQAQTTPFRPGMSASVSIQTESRANALVIPIQSITTRSELLTQEENNLLKANELVEQVFTLGSDNKVTPVRVTTGLQDHRHIEILSGLSTEDQIVVGPYTAISKTLKRGAKVTPKEEVVEEESAAKNKR